MKDYNKDMLYALNSVFWYEGLLDQEGDEWVDFDNFSRPKYKENCVICQLIKDLENSQSYYITDMVPEGFEVSGRHTVIWQMLVEMFGSCGTSPRTGWIEQTKECAEFLKTVMCAEELIWKEEHNK